MNKHILFVLDYFYPHKWGLETVFLNIISRLIRDGYKVTILTSRFDKKLDKFEQKDFSKDNKLKAESMLYRENKFVHIYRAGTSRWSFLWKWFWMGRKILQKYPDINMIHTSTYGGAIPAWLLGKLFHKKVLLTVHEIFGKLRYLYKWRFGWKIFELFEKILFRLRFDVYHCVSRYTMNCLRVVYGIPDAKLKMIYNGVDLDFRDSKQVSTKDISNFQSWFHRKNKFVLLYFGHSGKSKGIDDIIVALPKLLTDNPDMVVVFNLIHSQRTEIITHKIQNIQKNLSTDMWNIQIFNGFSIKNLRTLVASCDAVIAPSLAEGFGSVHTETIAMQKPLITTFIWPLPEVLWWKVVFIPPQSPKDIIKAVAQVRSGYIEERPAKIFSWEKTVEEITSIYDSLSTKIHK